MCRDLRNCQVYFPCKFFIGTESVNQESVKQCQNNYVFDETMQQCVKAESLEDFECILLSRFLDDSDELTTILPALQNNAITSTDSKSELDETFEKSNKTEKNKKRYSSLVSSDEKNLLKNQIQAKHFPKILEKINWMKIMKIQLTIKECVL